MKNTRDPFDDELRNRLDNYSEEPDDKLWSGIASNIETVKPPFAWTKWITISSSVVIITSALIYFSLNESVHKNIVDGASSIAEVTTSAEETQPSSSEIDDKQANGVVAETTSAQSSDHAHNERHDQQAADSQGMEDEAIADNKDRNEQQAQRTAQARPIVGERISRANERVQSDAATSSERVTDNRHSEARQPGSVSAARSTINTPNSNVNSDRTSATQSRASEGEQPTVTIGPSTNAVSGSQSIRVSVAKENDATKQIMMNEGTGTQNSQTSVTPVIVVGSETSQKDQKQGDVHSADAVKAATVDSVIVKSDRGVDSEPMKSSSEDDRGNNKGKSPRKLSLYLTAMPTFGYQRIEANQNDNVFIESISKVSNFSTKRLGVRAEIGVEYALSPKFRVFGGVLYYQRKQTIDYVERVPVNEVVDIPSDTVVIIQPGFTSEARTFEYELRNVGIQLGLNYVLKEKKFLHTIGTGIEFHKALNKLPEEQKDLGFHSNPSTFVFANLYYRLQYPAQGKLRAVVQPTLNYSLYLNQDTNAPFFVKPYGLGLNVGVTYHF